MNEFLESRKLFPTRSATRNAAIAMQHLGRFVEALSLYDALFEQFGRSLSPQQQEPLSAERQALLARVGQVSIVNSESNTAVAIDGEQRAVTPLKVPIFLDPGMHTVRLSKDGCDAVERQVAITSGTTRNVDGQLHALSGVGTLVVTEANGEPLDVLVDAAAVGKVPFRGNVAAGLHSVLLRGDRRGTPPRVVSVELAQVATLSLQAIALDSDVIVAPRPASSTIFVDGVFAGNGVWSGALPSGFHRIEAAAPEYLPFRADVTLRPGSKTTVDATLLRDRPTPMPVARRRSWYADPSLALLLGRSLGGGVDASCRCLSRSHPVGWASSAQFGHTLTDWFALEFGAGYLRLAESSTRTISARAERKVPDFRSDDYRENLTLEGPFASFGASARFFNRFPVTTRLGTGVALLNAEASNTGTFSGSTSTSQLAVGDVRVPEPSRMVVTPFISSELRVGYRLAMAVTVDVGVALQLFFPTHVERSNRYGLLHDQETGDVSKLYSGTLTLPDEPIAEMFLIAAPSAGLHVQF